MPGKGTSWERRLAVWHDEYRRMRLAYVVKCNPAVKVLSARGRSGSFMACWESKGPPDFMGTLAPNGRAVCFDAKDCNQPRFGFDVLTRKQAIDLEANMESGGISFVALLFNGDPYVIPWTKLSEPWWSWAEKRSKGASLSAADIALIGIPMSDDGWIGCL